MIRCAPRILLMVLPLLLLAPGLVQAQQWVEHRPLGAGYRIEFPSVPTLSSEDVPTAVGPIKLHQATVEQGQTVAFVAMHNAYPPGSVKNAVTTLNGARDGMVKHGRLRDERDLTVGGAPAKRIIIEHPQQSLISVILVVVSGDNLYQAHFVSPQGESSPDGQRFLQSFALLR